MSENRFIVHYQVEIVANDVQSMEDSAGVEDNQ